MIRTIAIDDEPLALQLVESYAKKTAFLDFLAAFDNPLSALDYVEKKSVQLIFLDIQMPDFSGIEFARSLIGKNIKVVFTTAFEKYAIEGYKLDVVDYLLKPYGYEEFLTASQKAEKLIEAEHKNISINANKEFLFLKSEYKVHRINFNEILFIEGLKDYVKIYVKNENSPIISLNSLKHIESKLPEKEFMRIHRSFIVNLNQVNIIDRQRIVFNKTYIPIGDQYKDRFMEFIEKNFL